MATFHKFTIDVKGWVVQDCGGCGGQFRYRFRMPVWGIGKTTKEARRNAESSTGEVDPSKVEPYPCPACGWVHPRRSARWTASAHLWLTLGVLFASVLVTFMGAATARYTLTYATTGLILAIGSAVGLLLHALVPRVNPHRGPGPERRVELVNPPNPKRVTEQLTHRGRHLHPLIWGGVGVLLMFSPWVLKTASGWQSIDGAKPDVVSPGDTMRVWFPDNFESVAGLWRGVPRSGTLNRDEVQQTLSVSSQSKEWGQLIKVEAGTTNTSFFSWADVQLPDDPSLAGTVVEVEVVMEVQYPLMRGGQIYTEESKEVRTRQRCALVPRWASIVYRVAFWAGVCGIGLVTLSGWRLWAVARRRLELAPLPDADVDPEVLEPDE